MSGGAAPAGHAPSDRSRRPGAPAPAVLDPAHPASPPPIQEPPGAAGGPTMTRTRIRIALAALALGLLAGCSGGGVNAGGGSAQAKSGPHGGPLVPLPGDAGFGEVTFESAPNKT